jgi:hypothetical protein
MKTNDNPDETDGGFSRDLAAILTAIATITATIAGLILLWHPWSSEASPGPAVGTSPSASAASAHPSTGQYVVEYWR